MLVLKLETITFQSMPEVFVKKITKEIYVRSVGQA